MSQRHKGCPHSVQSVILTYTKLSRGAQRFIVHCRRSYPETPWTSYASIYPKNGKSQLSLNCANINEKLNPYNKNTFNIRTNSQQSENVLAFKLFEELFGHAMHLSLMQVN